MPKIAIRWQIAILLCLITMINYLDRQAFAVAGPVIVERFSLSNTQFGAIGSAFLFAYAIGQLVTGPIVDRLGTKRSFSIAVVAWSIAGILHALGRGFWSFFALRGLLGLTEAMNLPAAVKAVAEWFPKAERSMAVGIVTAGVGLGAIVAPPFLGWLIIVFGWQWAFVVPGVMGFFWLIIWRARYSDPHDHPGLTEAERAALPTDSERDPAQPWYAFVQFFRYREVWGLMLSRFVSDGAFYFFVAWLPLYLAQARGFNIREIAFSAIAPFVAADLGSLFGGWLGTRLIKRGMTVNASRKTVIWLGALVVPAALLAVLAESAVVAIALICVAMFAIQLKASSLFTVPADLFASRDVATIWGMFGAVGSLGGMLFVAAAGWVTDNYSYTPIFAAVGVMHILSAIIVMILIPDIKLLKTKN